jgi:hypothetical protein
MNKKFRVKTVDIKIFYWSEPMNSLSLFEPEKQKKIKII